MSDNSIIADLIEALKADDDPKKLTQEQVKRLTRRTESIAADHTRRTAAMINEKTSELPGAALKHTWSRGEREVTYHYDADHATEQLFLERAQLNPQKVALALLDAAINTIEDRNKTHSFASSVTIDLSKQLPPVTLKNRRKAGAKEFAKEEKRLNNLIRQIERDRDEIIDAAIFYKSEHVIEVLDTFANKRYE